MIVLTVPNPPANNENATQQPIVMFVIRECGRWRRVANAAMASEISAVIHTTKSTSPSEYIEESLWAVSAPRSVDEIETATVAYVMKSSTVMVILRVP